MLVEVYLCKLLVFFSLKFGLDLIKKKKKLFFLGKVSRNLGAFEVITFRMFLWVLLCLN
jgi:hypothetical protein